MHGTVSTMHGTVSTMHGTVSTMHGTVSTRHGGYLFNYSGTPTYQSDAQYIGAAGVGGAGGLGGGSPGLAGGVGSDGFSADGCGSATDANRIWNSSEPQDTAGRHE